MAAGEIFVEFDEEDEESIQRAIEQQTVQGAIEYAIAAIIPKDDKTMMNGLAEAGVQKCLECPICVSVSTTPKLLPCGHGFCEGCEQRLIDAQNSDEASSEHSDGDDDGVCESSERLLQCPVCRTSTQVPADGLPINYPLRNLIECLKEKQSHKRFDCSKCLKKGNANKLFRCECGQILCCHCFAKYHAVGHKATALADVEELWRQQLKRWRAKVHPQMEEIEEFAAKLDSGRKEASTKLEQICALVNGTFISGAQGALDDYSQFKSELEKFVSFSECQCQATLAKGVGNQCKAQHNKINLTKGTLIKVLERKDQVVAVIEDARREILKMFVIPQPPPDEIQYSPLDLQVVPYTGGNDEHGVDAPIDGVDAERIQWGPALFTTLLSMLFLVWLVLIFI